MYYYKHVQGWSDNSGWREEIGRLLARRREERLAKIILLVIFGYFAWRVAAAVFGWW